MTELFRCFQDSFELFKIIPELFKICRIIPRIIPEYFLIIVEYLIILVTVIIRGCTYSFPHPPLASFLQGFFVTPSVVNQILNP